MRFNSSCCFRTYLVYSYSDIVWSCCVFHSVSTCRQIWWALDSLHGREYEWHSHTFARESSAIWEITLEQVIIDAKAATAHMHMHKIRHQDAEICPATSIIKCLEAENVFVLSLSSGSVIKPQPHDFSDVNWRDTSENASFHLFYFSNPSSCCCKYYFPTAVEATSFVLSWVKPALDLWRFVEMIQRLIAHHWFFSLKCPPRMSANTEKVLHSLTQTLQVRKHPDWDMDQRQWCQTGWVRFMSVVEGKHFKQPDGLNGGLHALHNLSNS